MSDRTPFEISIPQVAVSDGRNYGRIDNATASFSVIEIEHNKIHEGNYFTCHYNNDCTNTGEMTIIAFNTPNTTKWLHMTCRFSTTAAGYFAIYEAPSLDNDEGSDLTVYNRDRNSSNISGITNIKASPTAGTATSFNETQAAGANLTTTNEIYRYNLGAVAGGTDINGGDRSRNEFILKQNTQYAFVIASTSSDDNTHHITLNWYEHTNLSRE